MKLLLVLLFCLSACPQVFSKEYKISISDRVIRELNISKELKRALGSGDIVGNGGGIVEQNFRYAYSVLSRLIDKCIFSSICPIMEGDQYLLQLISELSVSNIKNSDQLFFLSGKKYPDFFNNELDPADRVAKTAYFKGSPIFVNLDLVYNNHEDKVISFPEIVSVLIHELGHQLGVESHSDLDQLASAFRITLMDDFDEYYYSLPNLNVSIQRYNFFGDFAKAELMLSVSGEFHLLSAVLSEKLRCPENKGEVKGSTISNGHWKRPQSANGHNILSYLAWVKYRCVDDNNTVWEFNKDLQVDIHYQLNFEGELPVAVFDNYFMVIN